MKRAAIVVVLSLFVLPMYGAQHHLPRSFAGLTRPVDLQVRTVVPARASAVRLLSQLKEVRTVSGGVGANAVTSNRSARALVIPAAGSVQGANNTFFRSDVTLVNWNDADQKVAVLWLPQGNPSGLQTFGITIPGNRPPFTVQDFVGTALHLSGLGALVFVPVDANSNPDDNAAIDAYSRIWTPQPNATGTVSQPFPGVEPAFMTGEYEAAVIGLRHDAGYRSNFGIVNLSEQDLPFSVLVVPDSAPPGTTLPEVTVTVPALSMIQQNIPPGTYGPLTLITTVETDVPTADHTWITYGTSTDNITGDGWVSLGANIFADDDLDAIGQ